MVSTLQLINQRKTHTHKMFQLLREVPHKLGELEANKDTEFSPEDKNVATAPG